MSVRGRFECLTLLKPTQNLNQLNGRYGKVDVVPRLLSIGVNPNIRTRNQAQESALHIAASRNFADIALILCDQGADPKMLDANGKTPSDRAKSKGHEFLSKMLKETMNLTTSPSPPSDVLQHDSMNVPSKSKEDIQENIIKQCISQDLSLHERCAMLRSGSFDLTLSQNKMIRMPSEHDQDEDVALPPPLPPSSSSSSSSFLSVSQNLNTTQQNNDNTNKNDPVASVARALQRMSTDNKSQGKGSIKDAIDMMSEIEKKRVEKDAAIIRRSARGWLLRRHYMKLREATLLVQKSLRRKWQRREQIRRDEAGRKIERWVRSVKAAIVLQNQVRQDRRTQAASTIQKWTRRQQQQQQQHQKRRRRE